MTTAATPSKEATAAIPAASQADGQAANPLLSAPVLPTLLRFALPNMAAMVSTALAAIAETAYVGSFGSASLAGMALVFPMIMLQQMMSAGAMGGGVSSAVSRALGADDTARASALAVHAMWIGLAAGAAYTGLMLAFGPAIYAMLGGSGEALVQAVAYSNVAFVGSIAVWLTNTFASVVSGSGNMKLPSLIVLGSAACQIVLGGVLGLGLGPVPQFGMRGVAAGSLTAYTIAGAVMAWYIFSGRARVTPRLRGLRIQRGMFVDILKVGAVSCFSPLQSVLTITIFTHMLAQFGTEILAGYGIGARLEFMLTSIAFAVGIASVPMVGMAIGAARIARARRIAWVAGWVSFISVGGLATLVAIFPDLWVNIFTHDPGVRAASQQYLSTVAPFYAFLGLATAFSRRKGRRKSWDRCSRKPRGYCSWPAAAGGCRCMTRPPRVSLRWPRLPWWCSACCPPRALL